jgi:hypothetical protein
VATRTLSAADFAVPIDGRYFEHYRAGAVYEYGYATVGDSIRSRSMLTPGSRPPGRSVA